MMRRKDVPPPNDKPFLKVPFLVGWTVGSVPATVRRSFMLIVGVGSLAIAVEASTTNATERVEFREPQVRAYLIEQIANPATTPQIGLDNATDEEPVQGYLEGTTNIVEFTSRVVLQLEAGRQVEAFLAKGKLTLSRTIGPRLFILQASDSRAAIEAAARLGKQPGVIASYPVMRRPLKRHNFYS